MYGGQRAMVPTGRVPEYLENIKAEFDTLAHDANMYKMQRDDYERKLQAQLTELTNIQQTLFDLERNHTKIKQQYEEEIMRLRRQLEMQSGGIPPPAQPNFRQNPGMQSPVAAVPPGIPPRGPPVPMTTMPPAPEKQPVRGPEASNPGMFPYGTNALAPLDPSKRYAQAPPGPGLPPAQPVPSAPSPALVSSVVSQQQLPPVASPTTTPKRQRESTEMYPPANGQSNGSVTPTSQSAPRESNLASLSNADNSKQPSKMDLDGPAKLNNREEVKPKLEENGTQDWIVGYNPGVQTSLNIDLLHTFEHNSVVCCVKFSNDGKYVATGCNKTAQIYDVDTGEKVHTFTEDIGREGDLYIRSVCFSPDGRYLAAGAEDKTVKLWDIDNKRLQHTFMGHELDIYSLDFSRDGRFIVSGSGDKKAKIWDVEKGECLFTLGNEEVGPKDGVTSVAFSPDGRLVAAGSLDRIVRVWDAQTGYFLERYEGHTDSVYSVAFSPDGKSLASGSLDKTLKLWELGGSRARARCRSNFTGHKDFVLSVAFSPDGNWLISGSKDRSVQFWDPRSAVSHMMLQGHKNSVISVAVSPQGRYFATGSGDFRARVWKYE